MLSTYKGTRRHNPQVYSLYNAVALKRVLFYNSKHLYVKSLPDITAGEMRNETAVYHMSVFSISSLSNVWFPSISKRKFLQASYSNFNHPPPPPINPSLSRLFLATPQTRQNYPRPTIVVRRAVGVWFKRSLNGAINTAGFNTWTELSNTLQPCTSLILKEEEEANLIRNGLFDPISLSASSCSLSSFWNIYIDTGEGVG